jgi:hypothetical protein
VPNDPNIQNWLINNELQNKIRNLGKRAGGAFVIDHDAVASAT